MTKQNYFYKILSSRHYNFILNRIAHNASYQWINEKSNLDLTKQLDSTEKGLQYIFSFITQFVRLISVIFLSIFVISWNYKACFVIFSLFSLVAYYISTQNFNAYFGNHNQCRNTFQLTNRQNSLIISDNISLLFDSVVHNDFSNIIRNIVAFNSKIKTDQTKMYSDENRLYIKIGLTLMTAYIGMLIVVTFLLDLSLSDFTLFFIAALLTYKCISNNINEILDMYADIRQTEIDFWSLNDIWLATSTKRPSNMLIDIPSVDINYEHVKKYCEYRFNIIGIQMIKNHEAFFAKYKLEDKFKKFCHVLKIDVDTCGRKLLLYSMQKFISSTYSLTDKYHKYKIISDNSLNSCIGLPMMSNDDIYIYKKYKLGFNDGCWSKKSIFTIFLKELQFCYPNSNYTDYNKLYTMKYTGNPIKINSNSHILIDGVSGSGKTTLLKIIRGILPIINKGHNYVKIDIDIHEDKIYENITWLNLINSISYCQQNSFSFNGGSIYQILSDDFISKDQDYINIDLMKQALEIACVDYKFKDINFVCTNKTISEGQKQRLALAKNLFRIFKKDKHIIILDEVDAGLDLETAKKILINLDILFKDRILLVVLHTNELKTLFKHKITIKDGCIAYQLNKN
jgi:ABC-type multidrug transport system fused ATPase/permease subunit